MKKKKEGNPYRVISFSLSIPASISISISISLGKEQKEKFLIALAEN
jgi:hypothetical protein